MQALFVDAINLVRFGSLMGTRHYMSLWLPLECYRYLVPRLVNIILLDMSDWFFDTSTRSDYLI